MLAIGMCSYIKSQLQVRRHIPQEFSVDVFKAVNDPSEGLPQGVIAATHLPQDLLACWLVSAAPVLDLRASVTASAKWQRLFVVLLQCKAAFTAVHVRAVSVMQHDKALLESASAAVPEEVQQLLGSGSHISTLYCSKCSGLPQRPSRVFINRKGPSRSLVETTAYCETCENHNSLRVLSPDSIQGSSGASRNPQPCGSALDAQLLHTLAGLLLQLTQLQHLGLHDLPLQPQLMPLLGELLLNLPSPHPHLQETRRFTILCSMS